MPSYLAISFTLESFGTVPIVGGVELTKRIGELKLIKNHISDRE